MSVTLKSSYIVKKQSEEPPFLCETALLWCEKPVYLLHDTMQKIKSCTELGQSLKGLMG